MAQFEPALQSTLLHEGGYSNNPSDSGGETYEGISRNNWPEWEGWPVIDAYPDKQTLHSGTTINSAIVQAAVVAFYRQHFWLYDNVNTQQTANKIFDLAVNVGQVHAHKIVQAAVYVPVDGVWGTATCNAVNATSQGVLLQTIKFRAEQYHREIVQSHPQDAQFLRGWLARDAS